MPQKSTKQITEELLSLPISDRVYIADCLLVSLVDSDEKSAEQQEEISRDWANEIRDRIKEFEAGNIETEDTFEVINEFREELKRKYAHPAAS